jgi:hypothetical protein
MAGLFGSLESLCKCMDEGMCMWHQRMTWHQHGKPVECLSTRGGRARA